jgi:hypothetical protein
MRTDVLKRDLSGALALDVHVADQGRVMALQESHHLVQDAKRTSLLIPAALAYVGSKVAPLDLVRDHFGEPRTLRQGVASVRRLTTQ